MKLSYAPQSPFCRKVRMAAIELGLGDHIEFDYVEVKTISISRAPNFATLDPLLPAGGR